jgi:hypothetical protein
MPAMNAAASMADSRKRPTPVPVKHAMSIGLSGSVSVSNVVNGISSKPWSGLNMTNENHPREHRYFKELTCANPEFCEKDHNDDTGHHYGCLCVPCSTFYYRKLK